MIALVVENDLIVNRIIVDDLSFAVGEDRELIDADGEIGWIRQPDGTFAPEAE